MYVYIITTKNQPTRYYIGCTSNLKQRFQEHNDGKSPHTAKYRPWLLKTRIPVKRSFPLILYSRNPNLSVAFYHDERKPQ